MIGALAKYISTENDKFQPMNANFGIVPELGEKIKDKKVKYGKLADIGLEDLKKIKIQKNLRIDSFRTYETEKEKILQKILV